MSVEQGLRFSSLSPYFSSSEGRYYTCSRESVVGTATRYELDGPGIKTRQRRDFPHSSRLPPPSPNVYWVFPEVKRPERGDDYPLSSSAGW